MYGCSDHGLIITCDPDCVQVHRAAGLCPTHAPHNPPTPTPTPPNTLPSPRHPHPHLPTNTPNQLHPSPQAHVNGAGDAQAQLRAEFENKLAAVEEQHAAQIAAMRAQQEQMHNAHEQHMKVRACMATPHLTIHARFAIRFAGRFFICRTSISSHSTSVSTACFLMYKRKHSSHEWIALSCRRCKPQGKTS